MVGGMCSARLAAPIRLNASTGENVSGDTLAPRAQSHAVTKLAETSSSAWSHSGGTLVHGDIFGVQRIQPTRACDFLVEQCPPQHQALRSICEQLGIHRELYVGGDVDLAPRQFRRGRRASAHRRR